MTPELKAKIDTAQFAESELDVGELCHMPRAHQGDISAQVALILSRNRKAGGEDLLVSADIEALTASEMFELFNMRVMPAIHKGSEAACAAIRSRAELFHMLTKGSPQ